MATITDLPPWAYDGSSTYQAAGENSDMLLKPVAWCRDPFFRGDSKLVMCEAFDGQGKPASTVPYVNLFSDQLEQIILFCSEDKNVLIMFKWLHVSDTKKRSIQSHY